MTKVGHKADFEQKKKKTLSYLAHEGQLWDIY